MEIDPINRPRHLVEAYIIKPLETRTTNFPDPMIRHQKLFFPSHKHIFAVRAILVVEVGLLGLFREGPPGGETGPMLHVFFIASAPVVVAGLECILGADDFAFEECGQGCVFGGEACCGLARSV